MLSCSSKYLKQHYATSNAKFYASTVSLPSVDKHKQKKKSKKTLHEIVHFQVDFFLSALSCVVWASWQGATFSTGERFVQHLFCRICDHWFASFLSILCSRISNTKHEAQILYIQCRLTARWSIIDSGSYMHSLPGFHSDPILHVSTFLFYSLRWFQVLLNRSELGKKQTPFNLY